MSEVAGVPRCSESSRRAEHRAVGSQGEFMEFVGAGSRDGAVSALLGHLNALRAASPP